MPDAYTYAWTPDGYKGINEGDPVDHSGGGSDFEKLREGDRLFILTLRNGTVYLLGAMTVGEKVDAATAKRLGKRVFEDKPQQVLAQEGTASAFAFRPIPSEHLRNVRFITGNGEDAVKFKDGRPDSQTLRRLRQITDKTAMALELLLARPATMSPVSPEANALGLLTDADAVNAAIDEFKKLGRTPFLQKYGFKKSTRYLIYDGRDHFDSKAIAGAAVGYQHPERGPLSYNDFSGGDDTVVKKLESLGFRVIEQGIGIDWTPDENAAIVAAYFDMLGIVARGEKLNKAAHNAALREKLQRRTRGSIERKLMNVTAALAELSKPTLDGYAPNANMQDDLTPAIESYISNYPTAVEMTFRGFELSAETIGEDFDDALEPAPLPRVSGKGRSPKREKAIPKKFDFAARDEANRTLGQEGEEWVVRYEKHRLTAAGRSDLAEKIEHVSATKGDGLGYDIASFEEDGRPRWIEVKTTNAGAMSPFMLSPNEVTTSRTLGSSYFLYRVHSLRTKPRFFMLTGSLDEQLLLEASEYRARLRPILSNAIGIAEEV